MSFESTSSDHPALIHLSFADHDTNATLGAQLVNCDTTAPPPSKEGVTGGGETSTMTDRYMFTPGYATVGKLIGGDNTVAKKAGVKKGDIIIAVNGLGFRRFAQDYKEDQIEVMKCRSTDDVDNKIEEDTNGSQMNGKHESDEGDDEITVNHRVVPPGNAYTELLAKIKSIKAANGDPPLILSFERYGWDARPNSWNRFLMARDNNVPSAMQMIQDHELWKQRMFPIDLITRGMQKMIREKVISEIDVDTGDDIDATLYPRTVYVNYGKLLSMQTAGDISIDDIVRGFILFTERQLAHKSNDPRSPKTCQFIDFSGVSITTTGFRVDILKQIYNTFEPNYPETLHKMVVYPVSSMLATTAKTLLNFVNEKTKKKFLITNNLELACNELGWDASEVQECGSITEYMLRHEKAGTSFYHD